MFSISKSNITTLHKVLKKANITTLGITWKRNCAFTVVISHVIHPGMYFTSPLIADLTYYNNNNAKTKES